jgi:hypothetical protein
VVAGVVVASLVLAAVGLGPIVEPPGAAAAAATAAFEAVSPCRLVDTRVDGGRLDAGAVLDVEVHPRCGVPSSATSIAVTLTAIAPDDRGYLTLWPAGTPRPLTSSLNYAAGNTIGNLRLVALAEDGRFSVFSRSTVDVVVDVTGSFRPVVGATSSGRFVPVEPRRLVDTRTSRRPVPGSSVLVDPEVPDDAVAVAVTVATTGSSGPGFFSAFAAGASRPMTSILNTDRVGQTRSAAAVVPMSEYGFRIHTRNGDHVIVDITGYFTGPSAAVSDEGLFVATPPVRAVDTRGSPDATGGRIWDGGTREFDLSGVTGGDVAAVAVNLAVTETEDRGYAIAYPARTVRPLATSVNYDTAQMSISSASLVGVSEAGLAVHVREGTHVVVDVDGWFTGTPVAATGPVPVNEPPPPRRVTIVGDSAFAGMRWNGTLAGLSGMVVDHRLESCRRLVLPSCRGREGYVPRTVRSEIGLLSPGPEDILIVTAGYDDWHMRLAADFDAVIGTARERGFRHIVWVTYRSNVGYTLPFGGGSNYGEMNRILFGKAATGEYPDVRIWDYDAYTAGADGWFYADGIHERPLGSWGTADYLSREVAAYDDKPCPRPWRPGEAVDDPCPSPLEARLERGDFPDIAGLYAP